MTLHLHYWPTPNGKKVTIFLEEAELPYTIVPCNIGRGDQFEGDFPKLNPNTRMPLLLDDEPLGGGAPISVFESGAILLYLAEKSGKFWPQTPREKYEVVQWVIWQMANQGPKIGEFGHFKRLGDSKGDQSYALRRFSDETNRLYGVLNNRLYNRRYLAGDTYSIADMISYPWTVNWQGQDQDIAEFPYFKRWFDELSARPAVHILTVIVNRLPPQGHAAVLRHMARNLRHHTRGFPDLFIWNDTDYRFIEIKGENDHLAAHQFEWLRLLADAGINVSVEKVERPALASGVIPEEK